MILLHWGYWSRTKGGHKMPLKLDYYYGNEAEQYSFYRVPKLLFTEECFKSVSVEAKVLYGLLLDRMSLSVKNGWIDNDKRVFIICTINDIMETFGCADQKARKLLSELDNVKGIGLIERKRRGLGKPDIIYVKNFLDKSRFKKRENHDSGNVKPTIQEPRKSLANNTDLNNTDFNDTESINPHETKNEDKIDRIDEININRDLIKRNIDYSILLHDYPHEQERLDEIVNLIVEVVSRERKTIRINQENMPIEAVKSRFLNLNGEHIRYIWESFDKNTTSIRNIKAYMLSTLFNAPVTMGHYYTNLVNHDMARNSGNDYQNDVVEAIAFS